MKEKIYYPLIERVFKELCQGLHSQTQIAFTFKVYVKLRNGQRPILGPGVFSKLCQFC
jgi:hypothetical protein